MKLANQEEVLPGAGPGHRRQPAPQGRAPRPHPHHQVGAGAPHGDNDAHLCDDGHYDGGGVPDDDDDGVPDVVGQVPDDEVPRDGGGGGQGGAHRPPLPRRPRQGRQPIPGDGSGQQGYSFSILPKIAQTLSLLKRLYVKVYCRAGWRGGWSAGRGGAHPALLLGQQEGAHQGRAPSLPTDFPTGHRIVNHNFYGF